MEGVRKSWKNCSVGFHVGSKIKHKIKAVKIHLKAHFKEKKNEGNSVKVLGEELTRIESLAVAQGWLTVLREKRLACLVNLWKRIRIDEQNLRQISRVKWLREGDGNSKFFHIVSNVRKRSSLIEEISISGRLCCGPEEVREGVFSYFKDHFKRVESPRLRWDDVQVNQISEKEKIDLEAGFSVEEVWKALCECDGNKAPGPDGLNLNFIKKNWDCIKDDFLNALHAFHVDGSVIKDLNCTFIALILKLKCPGDIKDYRPISLVGSFTRSGFGGKWKGWIKWCVSSPSLSVLDVPPSKGDGLSEGCSFWNGGVHICHLQFADDTILFLDPKLEYLLNAKRILRCFELVSGLKITFHKSCLVRVGKKRPGEEDWATAFRCVSESLPVTYLGFPMGGISSREGFWNPVVRSGERIRLWQDVKWDSFPLIRAFPRIYALASDKSGVVSDFGSWEDTGIHLVAVDLFYDFLWQGLCPPKIEVFVWQLLKGRTLVKEVLLRLGVAQGISTVCPMCSGGS
ncbi:hypothetical protein Dsin_022617 [Dipteronia sinensis]|uniref:Reverse transcriptase domain-containing protein n=1 Tax=Dipteronia sinensis TaxID=43782 RepID=A0AAE0A2Q6_9ROSI|nr:hypothetical protein Dsin_022617 [Dipteronia sinensis]